MGSFLVMRPPARPTPSNSQPVLDSALKNKIVAARSILGKDVVDDEDLWNLERQGAFRARRGTRARRDSQPGRGFTSVAA